MTTPKADDDAPKAGTADGLKKAARGMSGLALETLGQIMKGTGQDSAKLAAAREVLDRAHGKPKSARTAKAKPAPVRGGMTVIVKRFTDITPEEQAAADATEREEW